jgi:hypothetical protein
MSDIYLSEDLDNYKLVAKLLDDKGDLNLRITHKFGGKHFAEHKEIQILNEDLEIIGSENINKNNISHLILNIKKNGINDGLFVIKDKNNFYTDRVLLVKSINPESVRHKETLSEKSFTATGEKLNFHWPIFKKYKETGYGSIIRATMTLHQVCMSRCQFCSTIGRNKKDSINLDEAKNFINALYDDQANFNIKNFPQYNQEYKRINNSDIRLQGLILSGGGQPNLWPHFSEFVEWVSKKNISLGLITNGFPKNVPEEVYEKFEWIRISITPEDASNFYPQGKFNLQYIPKNIINNPKIALGLSYVYGPWTTDEILNRINKTSVEWNCEYVRVLTDCNLSRDLQLLSHKGLSNRLFKLGLIDENGNPKTKIFHQLKYHGTKKEADFIWDSGQCYLQVFNTFWDTTGHEDNSFSYCYPCDSVTVLAEGNQEQDYNISNVVSERKFNYKKWGTVKNNEVDKLYTEKVRPFFDPRKNCSACLFQKNNAKAKDLSNLKNYEDISINKNIKHINFP